MSGPEGGGDSPKAGNFLHKQLPGVKREMKYRISANVIRRLPRYLRRMTLLERQGVEKVSSTELGGRMGLTASQIRQDFNCFGGFGQQGYGYNVRQLREGIGGILGLEDTLAAVVIGAGNLGRALIANFHFGSYGFELKAAFDTDPALIGTVLNGAPVLDGRDLETYLAENRVDVAVLTMPKAHAARIAKLCSDRGVRGIWNFTGTDIDGDLGGAVVEDVHLSDSLLTLGYYLRGKGEQ